MRSFLRKTVCTDREISFKKLYQRFNNLRNSKRKLSKIKNIKLKLDISKS